MTRSFLLLGCLAAVAVQVQAQAGPPFRTDDPEAPGNGHWEINVGFLGDRSSSDGDYQVPDLDLNYGWGDRIQLKYELPRSMQSTGRANARFGPIRLDGEVGYWFTNRHVPQSWTRGLVVGHEFSSSTEFYLELADEQDANRIDGLPKAREATLGLGGRQALNRPKI